MPQPRHRRRSNLDVQALWDALVGGAVVLIHVAVVLASAAGPILVAAGTFEHNGRLSFAAWRHVFEDWQRWVMLLGNTSVACAWAVGLCIVAGLVLSIIVFRTDVWSRVPAIGLCLLATVLPLYVVNAAALAVVGAERAMYSPAMVGVIHAAAHLPIVVLIIGAALRSVSAELEEAAQLEGAGLLRLMLHVTLPSAIAGIVASVVLVVLWVATDYSVSDILLVRTFAEEVYTQYAMHGRSDEPMLVCMPQIILFAALLWVFRRGYLTGDSPLPTNASHRLFKTRRWRTPFSLATGAIALVLGLGPVILMVSRLTGARGIGRTALSFTAEITVSLTTSLAAGVIAAALGVGLAWCIVRRHTWWTVLTGWVVLMLAVPAPILGIGMIRLFNRPGLAGDLYDSPAILVVAYVFRFLPIAVILLVPAIRAIPIECEMVARVDGCNRAAVWRRIIWPQCVPSALLAMFAVMVLSVGELPCSLLVTPPGHVTVGARFFSLIHYGLYPDAALLCLLSIATVLMPWLGLLVLLRRRLLR